MESRPLKRHTYAAAERFVLSREFFGMKLGLKNVSDFLEYIGSPQHKYPTIHLSGTNGKGSCAAMLASVLTAAGHKTGLFTSPHLVSMRERIRIDGRLIHPRSVVAFVDRYRAELARRKISFFELFASMAFWHFARQKVDVAVIETGLGGRLDATNVLTPCLTITTDISRDHVEILGHSLRKIAFEKAGIVKPGVPHLIGNLPRVAADEMSRICRSRQSPLHRLDQARAERIVDSERFDFADENLTLPRIEPPLAGPHQATNTALVVKALGLLQESFAVSKASIHRGLANTEWPGRFQIRRRHGQPTIIMDVAHNERGVAAFVETFKERYPGRKAHVLIGFVKRKPHQQMFDALSAIAETYVLVPLATHRSIDLRETLARIDLRGVPVERWGSLKTGYRKLASRTGPGDIIIVIGSHYLVGEFIQRYGA